MATLNPDRVQPLHDVTDDNKYSALVTSMREHGWTGAPIITITGRDYGWGPGDPLAITGSHRIAAAREVGIDVPAVDLNGLLAEYGTSLAELDEQFGADPDDEWHYEVLRRLDEVLPSSVSDYYGLDAH